MEFIVIVLVLGGVIALIFASLGVKNLKQAEVYKSKRFMNGSESKLYNTLEGWRRKHAKDLVLSPQVPYGAFITASTQAERNRVAYKRADFVFWARDGYVRAIVEFDGAGHYGNSKSQADKVQERDRVKNEAARSANIPLIRIPPKASAADITNALQGVLSPPQDIKIV